MPSHSRQPPRPAPPSATTEVIDPRWLLKTFLAVLLLGIACAYILICAIFYAKQWQLVLQPSRAVSRDPGSLGLAFQEVHFAPDAAGTPQLDGWWIPGDTPDDPAALLLHGSSGNMANSLSLAKDLHDARLSVLLVDYRGYGRSAGEHPDQKSMQVDARSALTWMITSQNVVPGQLLVVGQGLGASLATQLCAKNLQIGGLVLVDGDGDTAERASRDPRSHIVPFGLLYHENFPLAETLATLHTPKLLISHTMTAAPVDVQRAADPKMSYEIGPASNPDAVHMALRRFMDTYLTQAPPQLTPAH